MEGTQGRTRRTGCQAAAQPFSQPCPPQGVVVRNFSSKKDNPEDPTDLEPPARGGDVEATSTSASSPRRGRRRGRGGAVANSGGNDPAAPEGQGSGPGRDLSKSLVAVAESLQNLFRSASTANPTPNTTPAAGAAYDLHLGSRGRGVFVIESGGRPLLPNVVMQAAVSDPKLAQVLDKQLRSAETNAGGENAGVYVAVFARKHSSSSKEPAVAAAAEDGATVVGELGDIEGFGPAAGVEEVLEEAAAEAPVRRCEGLGEVRPAFPDPEVAPRPFRLRSRRMGPPRSNPRSCAILQPPAPPLPRIRRAKGRRQQLLPP